MYNIKLCSFNITLCYYLQFAYYLDFLEVIESLHTTQDEDQDRFIKCVVFIHRVCLKYCAYNLPILKILQFFFIQNGCILAHFSCFLPLINIKAKTLNKNNQQIIFFCYFIVRYKAKQTIMVWV